MLTYHQIRDVLELALEHHGPYAHALAGAAAELVPSQHRGQYVSGHLQSKDTRLV